MPRYLSIISLLFLLTACTNNAKEPGNSSNKAASLTQQIAPLSIDKVLQQRLNLPLAIASPNDSILKKKLVFEQLPLWLQKSVYWPRERRTAEGFYFEPEGKGKKGGIQPELIGVLHQDKIASMLFFYNGGMSTIAGRYKYQVYEIRNYNLETKQLIDSLPVAKYVYFKDGGLTEVSNSHTKINKDLSIVNYSRFEDYDDEEAKSIHNIYTDTLYYKMMADGKFRKGR